jgi:hypothetical protein
LFKLKVDIKLSRIINFYVTVEGSLEIVDFLFNQLYDEPLFGEVLIK